MQAFHFYTAKFAYSPDWARSGWDLDINTTTAVFKFNAIFNWAWIKDLNRLLNFIFWDLDSLETAEMTVGKNAFESVTVSLWCKWLHGEFLLLSTSHFIGSSERKIHMAHVTCYRSRLRWCKTFLFLFRTLNKNCIPLCVVVACSAVNNFNRVFHQDSKNHCEI